MSNLTMLFDAKPSTQSASSDLWPGNIGYFVRQQHTQRSIVTGHFGLLPTWAKSLDHCKYTYNARSESAEETPSFRHAWHRAQRCIIPASAIYEPLWTASRALAARIYNADHSALGIAGLWSRWQDAENHPHYSFTLLTICAEQHPFMRQFHRPEDRKRMVAILAPEHYHRWLNPGRKSSAELLQPYPGGRLRFDAHDPTPQQSFGF